MTHLERLAKAYEVENYFDYIITSQMNGNFEQVRELAKKLKRNELVQFVSYCHTCGGKYGIAACATLTK